MTRAWIDGWHRLSRWQWPTRGLFIPARSSVDTARYGCHESSHRISTTRHALQSTGSKEASRALLRAILASPHFIREDDSVALDNAQGPICSLPMLDDRMSRSAAQTFERLVAQGSASLESATHCLMAQLRHHDLNNSRDGKHTGFTLDQIVLNWLWSSGQMERMDFIKHHRFTTVLVRAMIHANRRQIVLDWVRYFQSNKAVDDLVKGAAILDILVKAEMRYGQGPGASIDLFRHLSCCEKAARMLQQREARCTIRRTLLHLVRMAPYQLQKNSISQSQYDHLMEFAQAQGHEFLVLELHLAIRHPTAPLPEIALRVMQDLESIELTHSTSKMRLHYLSLTMQAVQQFLDKNEFANAKTLMTLVEKHFADLLGQENSSQTAKLADELSNIGLLHRLQRRAQLSNLSEFQST